MNEEDQWMRNVERDASPERFQQPSSSAHQDAPPPEKPDNLTRTATAQTSASSSSSSSSSSNISIQREEIAGISRMPTERDDANLERHATALSRVQTGRSQQNFTVGAGLRSRTVTRESKKPLPAFGGGKQYPPMLPARDEYVVEFDGPNDPLHAQNWPLMRKKMPVAITLGFVTLTAAFGSSIFSAAIASVAEQYSISGEVGILGVSLYVLGFATGPIIWAPMSELYGRRYPLIVSSFGFSVFNVAVAAGKDLQTIFICRFFGGFFGACPLTVVGAVFADML